MCSLYHVARRNKANHNAPHVCRDERVKRKCHHVTIKTGPTSPAVVSKTFRALMVSVRHKHEGGNHQKETCPQLDVNPVMKGSLIGGDSSEKKHLIQQMMLFSINSFSCERVHLSAWVCFTL